MQLAQLEKLVGLELFPNVPAGHKDDLGSERLQPDELVRFVELPTVPGGQGDFEEPPEQ